MRELTFFSSAACFFIAAFTFASNSSESEPELEDDDDEESFRFLFFFFDFLSCIKINYVSDGKLV